MRNGSVQLFKLFGITVYLHWSWLLVAALMISYRKDLYSNATWAALEYATLFGIVLLHEFGHALACRSVGGKAEQIMLWPLGGIAYVAPPMRPGALLWSIFAGPLVNIILLPITIYLALHFAAIGASPDLVTFFEMLAWINGILLGFNMLPIYPLDGGQILHSLLWFPLGFGRSLRVASFIGILGAVGLGVTFLYFQVSSPFMYVIVAFIGLQAYNGYRTARILADHPEQAARLERTRPGEEPKVVLDETPQPRRPVTTQRPTGQVRVPPPFDSNDQYRPPHM